MSNWQASLGLIATGPTTFSATISDEWSVGTYPDGGYVAAAAVRAMSALVRFPDPVAVTTTFLRPTEPGVVTIDVEIVRTGRTVAVTTARMVQNGKERNRTIATFADLSDVSGNTTRAFDTATRPDLPEPSLCVPALFEPTPGFELTITRATEMRFAPGSSILAGAPAAARTVVSSWIRFADGSEPDVFAPLLAVDAFLPVPIEAGFANWSPTLELSVYLRARPAPGWLGVRRSTSLLANGYFEEDGEVWDSADQLVAQSRQLSRLGAPRTEDS